MNKEKQNKLIIAGENYLKFAIEPHYGKKGADKYREARDKVINE